MCGIVGAFDSKKEIGIPFIKDMLDKIKFRGNEETLFEMDCVEDAGVFLGTNRLPITKPMNNKQPVVSENNEIMLVMNAEIFNYRKLSADYGLNNIIESDSGDTIFLAEFISNYGIKKTLSEINFEGAFIYFDKKSKQIVFARDHLGIKPLYYISENGKLLISSEIKGLVDYKCSRINVVEPGHVYFYDLESQKLESEKWFTVEKGLEKESLSEIFKSAVEERIPDEKYAILLSGGLDSSLVMAAALRKNRNFVAYTLCTCDSPDLLFARNLCKKHDIELIEVKAESSEQLKEKIPKIVGIVESWQWQVINHSAPMDVLFKKIHDDGIKVVLTGEGADELFFGYDNYGCEKEGKNEERIRRIQDLHKTNCRRLDRMAMAYSIECRVPFLDKRMVQHALNYSFDECVTADNNKMPLRKMAEEYLDIDYCQRKKLSLAKGAGYKYGSGYEEKNVFGINNDFSYDMSENKYMQYAIYPIERYLIDIAYKLGYLKAEYLLTAGI
ncbi:asparagine synthetase B family protein [Ruminococcus flavefaciens]|uniref:asparagine synthase (glutamine-hydrolyzing) n=1 Tax=Ruminococcus flavefaciens TaxID=1265 RepID=A0A1M7GD76_RUMFL|nr:asparagine synthase-related protein [Ruminococcus flavefaciens]SHM13819.1 asparagine synthase (glutamine-hydrolysing) [Ruminococcus flavefaciens]